MSRKVYTYTDLSKLKSNKYFIELLKYPHIAVSADLRKCINGNTNYDKVEGIATNIDNAGVTQFKTFIEAIDDVWNTDQSRFRQSILLSEFMRMKLEKVGESEQQKNWMMGCMRNIDSMLSAIILFENANVHPEQLEDENDRNIKLFVEAWKYLVEKDGVIKKFREKMDNLKNKKAWEPILDSVFKTSTVNNVDKIVFHGFYYFTPIQERIMCLLEKAGFELLFLIPYDDRYPYVYEIWDNTYSEKKGFEPKSKWFIEKSNANDVYGEVFNGKKVLISNKLKLKEYASTMEFVDDVKHIKEDGYSLYSADDKSANDLLKDYYPEAFGDRKILSYPIGQFINTLNSMWDETEQSIVIEEDDLIECFSSGWLSVDGISGKRYMQELTRILPFFNGCKTISDWENRINLFKEIKKSVIEPFETELDFDESVSRWQEAIGSPLKNFGMFSVDVKVLDIILKLINQLLTMAKELYGKNEVVQVHEHIRTLDHILRKNEISKELYVEERELVNNIFDTLGQDNGFDSMCHPSDISRALELFICGRLEDGEIQTDKVGLVYPFYFIEAAKVKNNSKVHICLSDVSTLPGKDKDYIWPLTNKLIKRIYDRTGNCYLENMMQIMSTTTILNRYFTYSALKNNDVVISWVSTMGEKKLAPSPYVKILMDATGVKLTPSAREMISFDKVYNTPTSYGRVDKYDKAKMPVRTIKEARMDYAVCPMKYILGYVLEKYPTFQSDFQTNYAINGFISAMYNLMKDDGVTIDQAYNAAISLFPNMRKVEKRQIYDYISYDKYDKDINYEHRTQCGERFYTDERIKIHYPNHEVRKHAIEEFGKLCTPDGRNDIDVNARPEIRDVCSFCQHIDYCKNAIYAVDQEDYYD